MTTDLAAIAVKIDAVAWGVARADRVDDEAIGQYRSWLGQNHHASMTYMERNIEVRDDPQQLLEGAKSIIIFAFPYYHSDTQSAGSPQIAMYAHGSDYHNVVTRRLRKAVGLLRESMPGDYRTCVDSAPLRERYWAVKAGVGFIGRNAQLIVPGWGSYCFIGSIVTTALLPATAPLDRQECDNCRRCIEACPGHAIVDGAKSIDARRCLSYLTVEAGRCDSAMTWPEGVERGNRLVGCDVCQQVCPHNRGISESPIEQFAMRDEVRNLNADTLMAMDEDQYAQLFAGSAIRRAPLSHIKWLLKQAESKK